jgi:hypothetical protein
LGGVWSCGGASDRDLPWGLGRDSWVENKTEREEGAERWRRREAWGVRRDKVGFAFRFLTGGGLVDPGIRWSARSTVSDGYASGG